MSDVRRWWMGEDEKPDTASVDAPAPAAPPARPELTAAHFAASREELKRKALMLPRGSSRRREVEKRLAKVTAEVLRRELKAS